MPVLNEEMECQSTPLISVAMAVYNGEQYLAEAIDSILAQTFTDFELIIIDDGSTDNSLQVLQRYQQMDTRIRLVTRENRNLATTLNDIIDLAQAKWVARMDQDDIALPYRFERQLKWLEKTGADISGSWVRRFGSSDKRVVRLRQTDDAIRMEMLFCSPFAHPTVMMRTSLAKQLRYDKEWEKAEDYDLWERAAEAQWKMTNVPEVLLLYRQHETQISTVTLARQEQLTQLIRRRYWNYVFQDTPMEKEWIDQVLMIRDPHAPQVDLDKVDAALSELFRRAHGESLDVIWDHVLRLYYRVAADYPDIVQRWVGLTKSYGQKSTFTIKFKLWVLSSLGLRPDCRLFLALKKLHIMLIRKV